MKTPEQLTRLWNFLRGLAVQEAQHQTYVTLPDPGRLVQRILPDQHYFQIVVADMFLSQRRAWFTEWFPAVTGVVQLRFAQQDRTPVCRLASPPKDQLGPGVFQNYPLTDLLPYGGGDVELQADLIALKGDNALALAMKLLESFSGLIGTPLAPALEIADTLAGGLNLLLNQTLNKARLGFHQRWTGQAGQPFEPGYHAVILEPEATFRQTAFPDLAAQFAVDNGRLCRRATPGGPPVPLAGYDYVLFRIEGSETRADWRFPDIQLHLANARKALEEGDPDRALKHRNAAISAVHASPDLVANDRTRVVLALKAELKAYNDSLQGGFNAATLPQDRTLNDVVERISPAHASGFGELTLAEALAE
jgi:hypothetical protein